MNNNILLIVEGSRDEQNIFSNVFLKYGFSPIVSDEKMDIDGVGQFDKYEYSLNDSSVVIIQGPKNRIHDFLKMFNENEMSIEKAFSYAYAYFSTVVYVSIAYANGLTKKIDNYSDVVKFLSDRAMN